MGIVHFAGLGKSPGAVTSGLSYLKHEMAPTFEEGDIVEAIVLFTSSEIVSGHEPSFKDIVHNAYMQRSVHKRWPDRMMNALEITVGFIKEEIRPKHIYLYEVDLHDFSACFEAVGKVTLRFHRPGKVGKHIWANITGGTNVLNAALMQVAYLSGFIPRIYYTFISNMREDGCYLQPFSSKESEFDYREIYMLKTIFDERHSHILEMLEQLDSEDSGRWVSSKELLGRIKAMFPTVYHNVSLNVFRRDFLNVMTGVARKGSRAEGQEDANRLGEDGKALLNVLRLPWVRALLRLDDKSNQDVEDISADVRLKELYSRK